MADEDRYTRDGFKLGATGGILPDPSTNLTDNRDFEGWDWKQIKAAIVGYAAMPAGAVPPGPSAVANPQSLWQAAVTIDRARLGLEYLSENVRLQSEALAGEDGPWSGTDADAFLSMTRFLAAKLNAKADQVNGGETTGRNNVPNELWTSGHHLRWAQQALNQIDSYYASWVAANGQTMANGLARISDHPDLVEQMSEDMRRVVRVLVNQYVLNIDNVIPPDPSDFAAGPGGLPELGGGAGGGAQSPPDIPPPGSGVGGPPPDLGGAGGGGGLPTPPSPDISAGPGGGALGGGALGGGAVPLPPAVNLPTSPNRNAAGGGLPTPPSLDIPAPGEGSGGLPTPPAVDIDVPAPGGAAGGLPTLPPALNLPTPPNRGAAGGGLPTPPSLDLPAPGKGTGGGTGGGGASTPPSVELPGLGGQDAGGVGAVEPPALGAPPSLSDGLGAPGTDRAGGAAAPPMMPPMGGAPPDSSGGADRPDASGLLGGIQTPWEGGSADLAGDPSEVGTTTGGPANWAVAPSGDASVAGAPPMMPPMMPPGGGAGGESAADRPDASGLLGGESKPWEPTVAEPTVVGSADAPAPSVRPEEWAMPAVADAPASTPESQAFATGMPMMPPVMPPAAGAPAGAPGSSDASTLIRATSEPWRATGPAETDPRETDPRETDPAEVASVPASRSVPQEWAAQPTAAVPAGLDPAGVAFTPSAPQATASAVSPPPPVSGSGPGSGRGVDSVAVVSPDDSDNDATSWDTGAVEFLLPAAVLAVVGSRRSRSDGATTPKDPGRSGEDNETEPDERAAHTTYRRRKSRVAPGSPTDGIPPSCGDEYSVAEEDRAAFLASLIESDDDDTEETDPEDDERSAADLLDLDDAAWGTTSNRTPTGVLE